MPKPDFNATLNLVCKHSMMENLLKTNGKSLKRKAVKPFVGQAKFIAILFGSIEKQGAESICFV